MDTAFQADAFQNDAFQIAAATPASSEPGIKRIPRALGWQAREDHTEEYEDEDMLIAVID